MNIFVCAYYDVDGLLVENDNDHDEADDNDLMMMMIVEKILSYLAEKADGEGCVILLMWWCSEKVHYKFIARLLANKAQVAWLDAFIFKIISIHSFQFLYV